MAESSTEKGTETMKKALFRNVTRGKWEEVVATYKKDPRTQKMQITKSGHTALHLAVSDAKEEVVEELVRTMSKDALEIQEERGHTPLHFAAAMGNRRMCECIAGADPSLVGARNKKGETPLFWAVLYGQREAFFCLKSICQSLDDQGFSYCRRSEDGQTILHCAIFGEDFEMADDIIRSYGGLVDLVDVQGYSPLHTLASKPSCFKSAANLGRWERIIYDSIIVDCPTKIRKCSRPKETHSRHPENYRVFVNFIVFLKTAAIRVAAVMGLVKKRSERTDIENGIEQEHVHSGDADDNNNLNRDCSDNNIGSNVDSSSSNKSTFNQRDALRKMNVSRQPWMDGEDDDNGHPHIQTLESGNRSISGAERPSNFNIPANYATCFEFVSKFVHAAIKATHIILGCEHTWIEKIKEEKEKHMRAVRIVEALLESSTIYGNVDRGDKPVYETENLENRESFPAIDHGNQETRGTDKTEISEEKNSATETRKTEKNEEKISATEARETAILVAAKYGVSEIVDRILQHFPAAIHDADKNRKNVLLLAAENRRSEVYKLLLERNIPRGLVMRKVDNEGNTALHFAAMFGENSKPWPIPGAALQMQWEIKWYKFVERSMPPGFFARPNNKEQTPELIFSNDHKNLLKAGGKWLTTTSSACSIVATLVATVAFASSTTFPGGTEEKSGKPTLENQPTFNLFIVSSLIALCSFTRPNVALHFHHRHACFFLLWPLHCARR